MRLSRWSLLLLAVVPSAAAGLVSRSALAQDAAPSAKAKALFKQGRALVLRGNYPAACVKFEQSFQASAAVGTEFNLADCKQHVGEAQRARSLFIDVAEKSHAAGRLDREREAYERVAAISEPPPPSDLPDEYKDEPETDEAPKVELQGPEVTEEPAAPTASETALVIEAPVPQRPVSERVTVALHEECDELAEAEVSLRTLAQGAAALHAPAKTRARLERKLTELRAALRDNWRIAGRVETELARQSAGKPKQVPAPKSGTSSAQAVSSR